MTPGWSRHCLINCSFGDYLSNHFFRDYLSSSCCYRRATYKSNICLSWHLWKILKTIIRIQYMQIKIEMNTLRSFICLPVNTYSQSQRIASLHILFLVCGKKTKMSASIWKLNKIIETKFNNYTWALSLFIIYLWVI